MNTCPVCLYPELPYPPRDYHICPCCSTEFGNDDARFSVEQLREMWIAGGARWFFGRPPDHWNPWLQLYAADLANWGPRIEIKYSEPDSSVSRFFFDREPEFQFSIHG